MPKAVRVRWDDPANTFYSDFPANKTFREVCHLLMQKMSAGQIAKRMKKDYPEITLGAIFHATKPYRENAPLIPCKECGRMVPGMKICASCFINHQEGNLSPRERQRLQEHMLQSAAMYAAQRPQKAMLTDEYTEG